MTESTPSVLIVVLNYNGWRETLTCIDSILAQTYQDFQIYLIDNGSADESLEKLAHFEQNEKITFVKSPVNTGFAGGVNIGIRYAIEHHIPHTVLLNNDASLEPDWLEILMQSMKSTGASVVTGLLLAGDKKTIESTADSYSDWGLPYPNQRGESVDVADDSGFVFGGTAGASIYQTALFEDIGLFDETFFAYFEDTDISFRTQLSGHKAYYEKAAVAYHDHGTTSSKIPGFTVKQTFQNLPLFFWKDVPARLLFPIGVRFFACYWLMYVRAVLRGQFSFATKGFLGSLRLMPHALHERRRIQKSRTVSYDYLHQIMHHGLPPNTSRKGRRIFHR